MKILTIVFILTLGLSAFGQTKKPLPKVKSPVVKATDAPVSEDAKTSTVQVTARLSLEKNEIVPVANNAFYLLSEDLAVLLSTRKMKELKFDDADNSLYDPPEFTPEEIKKEDLATLLRRMQVGYFPTYTEAARAAIGKAIKYRATSDAQGKAEFKDLPPGKYFLYVEYRTNNSAGAWYAPINAVGGLIKVNLDSNNRLLK